MENQACFKMQKEKKKIGEREQQKTRLHKSSRAHVTADFNAGSNSFSQKLCPLMHIIVSDDDLAFLFTYSICSTC